MRKTFGYAAFTALSLMVLGGCASETAAPAPEPIEKITRQFEGLTVHGELKADHTISMIGENAQGEAVVAITIIESAGELELFAPERRGKAGFALKPGARENLTLADWASFTNYSLHASDNTAPAGTGGVTPQRMKSCWSIFDMCCDRGDLCLWLEDGWRRL
jgi:hypothetical protein